MSITIGFDPEYFVKDVKTQRIKPVCGLIGGDKGRCVPLEGLPRGYGYHEDNVCAELNVPASYAAVSAYETLMTGIEGLDTMLRSKGLALVRGCPEWEFQHNELSHPKAQEFGCDPDFDSYSGGTQRVNVPNFGNYRFAGGHIHVGGNFRCPPFVVALMMDLGIGGRYANARYAPNRSKWYGAAGVFRPKPYGIEYRTLSSVWTTNPDDVYDVITRTYALAGWLETKSPTVIKRVVDSVDWHAVRERTGAVNPTPDICTRYTSTLKDARRQGAPV